MEPAAEVARLKKEHSLADPAEKRIVQASSLTLPSDARVTQAHSLVDPNVPLTTSLGDPIRDNNAFVDMDFDGTLDVLAGPRFSSQLSTDSNAAAPPGALEDLDFSMVEYFNDLSGGALGESPLANDATASDGRVPHTVSVGDIFDQIADLFDPEEEQQVTQQTKKKKQREMIPEFLDHDPSRTAAADDALFGAAWNQQKKQLLQPVSPSMW